MRKPCRTALDRKGSAVLGPRETIGVSDLAALEAAEIPPRQRLYPPEVDWAAPLPEHALDRLLDDAVRRFGERPCLDFLGRRYSYREVGDLVARAAKGLRALG